MKAVHTKEYYEKYRAELFEKYRGECDYETRLRWRLPDFETLPEGAREKAKVVCTRVMAEQVAKAAKEELLKKMSMIKAVKSGRASLGFTTVQQETREWHDLNEGFEFSCYMLAEFKKKYGIN